MINWTNKKLVVVGQGYVGLPLAIRAVQAGFDVVGYDLDKDKISALETGTTYIDDITGEQVESALATGRYKPTETVGDIEGFDVAVITVPTPLREGAPDISFITAATETLGRCLKSGTTVVLESTTYPGTTEDVVSHILEAESGLAPGRDFYLGYSPERIDPGNKTWTFEKTPKVVSGINGDSLDVIDSFYQQLVDQTVRVKGTKEAELTKLLENTFRHINIALVNELAIHAHALDIDLWDSIEAASTKPFGFMPFYPGPGVGGHCLPVDPSYLSWQFERKLGSVSRFVKVANNINDNMPAYVAKRVQAGLNKRRKPVNGSTILILGVAYKRNSNDARETPATPLIEELLSLGANVQIHDPHVERYELEDRVERVGLEDGVLSGADAVVVVTDHDDIDYDRVVELADYVFDSRHRLDETNAEQL